MSAILDTINKVFKEQSKATIYIRNGHPLQDALITEINRDTISGLTASYDIFLQNSELQQFTISITEIVGVSVIVASVNATACIDIGYFDDEDFNLDFD